jgi:PST family polysaccharide transporter
MSFARILRSSAIMGGAQVVVLAAGFVRSKVVALTVGVSGVGLVGVFSVFTTSIASVAGWGLGTAAVRVIASADEAHKPGKIAAVRRLGAILSGLGLLLALGLFWPAAAITFTGQQYLLELVIVGLAVPCMIASTAWSAILQASGAVKQLAKIQILGAVAGIVLGLPVIYVWGSLGIALSVLIAAVVSAAALWQAAHKLSPPDSSTFTDSNDLRELVKLGGALVFIGWAGHFSAYIVRIIIIRSAGLDAAGYYQAAFAISGSLPGFIFAAMGTDFFPRISAAKTSSEANELLERQIQAGLLLGVPLIAILLTLGRPCVHLLYERGFDPALPLLAWMTWGVFFRLISWPLGFWLMARSSPKTVIAVECLGNGLSIVLPLLLMPTFGLVGAAIAFFIGCLVYAIIVVVTYRLKSGHWPALHAALWAVLSAAVLLAAQAWSACQDSVYAGLVPVALTGAFCGWKCLKAIRP